MIGCFFGRKPPAKVEFLLRVLDAVSVEGLAELYGEARDRFKDPALMDAVNKRMAEMIDNKKAGMSHPPQITHVAIRYGDDVCALPKPNRHHNVIWASGRKGSGDVQGFLDENGTFLNRKEAYVLAVKSGQINRCMEPGSYNGDELFSEDLW